MRDEHQAANAGATPPEGSQGESAHGSCLSCPRLEEERDRLQANLAEAMTSWQADLAEAQATIQRVEEERDKWQRRYEAAREEVAAYRKVFAEAEIQRDTAQAQLAAMREALENAQTIATAALGTVAMDPNHPRRSLRQIRDLLAAPSPDPILLPKRK